MICLCLMMNQQIQYIKHYLGLHSGVASSAAISQVQDRWILSVWSFTFFPCLCPVKMPGRGRGP